MTAEMALAVVALCMSTVAVCALVGLYVKDRSGYATRGDVQALKDLVASELARMGASQSDLFRYVEAVDAHTGANGHKVLSTRLRRQHPG